MLSADERVKWLKVALSLGLFAGFVLSQKLWTSSRHYPLTPVSEYLPVIPFPIDYILFFSILILLIAITVVARPQKLILVFVILAIVLAIWDQSRWQPWFYQYLFMLAALGLYGWRSPDAERQNVSLSICGLIVASIYFWSGLQKLNAEFLYNDFTWILNPVLHLVPYRLRRFTPFLGLAIPLTEIFIGVGLLSRKFKTISVILALATHALILILLVPWQRNTVVWPWNLAMVVFVILLFWGNHNVSFMDAIATRKYHFSKLVILLFGLMPLFSFFDKWDSYLSSSLYSGRAQHAAIVVSESVYNELPPEVRSYSLKVDGSGYMLNLNFWSYKELNVPAYPERRVYRNIAKYFCAYAQNPSDVVLKISESSDILSRSRHVTSVDCSSLD